jgi:hypothetical protein
LDGQELGGAHGRRRLRARGHGRRDPRPEHVQCEAAIEEEPALDLAA